MFICLLFAGCEKNNFSAQNNTAIIKPNQLILPENMVLSRIDIKDTYIIESVFFNKNLYLTNHKNT